MINPEKFMRLAIDEAALSPAHNARVGAIAINDKGRILVKAHKSEDGTTKHAEELLIDKANTNGIDLEGATVYVTIEPCANLEGNRTSCAERLVNAKIKTVYIGRYDMNFRINRQGWKKLVDAGVECRDFQEKYRLEIDEMNKTFQGFFLGRTGALTGIAKFDWTTNGGKYDLSVDDDKDVTWSTRWTTCGSDSIYAYGGYPGVVALARYAADFAQIDDPGAYDYGSSSARLKIGEIGIYKNKHGYALVKILEVDAPPPYGTKPHISLKFEYELRPFDRNMG